MSTSPNAGVPDQTARRLFLALLLATTAALLLVIRPLATPLFFAAVLAGVIWPLQVRLSRLLRGRRAISAGVWTLAVVVLLITPLVYLSAFVVTEVTQGVRFVRTTLQSEGFAGLVERLPAPAGRVVRFVQDRLPAEGLGLEQLFQEQVTAQGGRAAAVVGGAVAATGSLLFQVTLALVAFFFLLLQGQQMVLWLDETLPLKPKQTQELLREFKTVSYSVLVSSVITAAVQAAVAFIGYLISRVPHPLFFATVTFFIAFIPALGAAFVCLVAALLLLVTGHPYAALFLALWAIFAVGLIDNVIKPLLIRQGMNMNGAVVFFALIGGLGAFGTVGLLLGPLVVALFLAMLRMYRRDFLDVPPGPVAP